MHPDSLVDRQSSRDGCALAEGHKDGFHADRAMCHVRCGETDRRKEVFAFSLGRDDRAIGNAVRSRRRTPDHAFVLHLTVVGDEVLHAMRVHAERPKSHWVRCLPNARTFELSRHVVANHAPRFANVDHPWPAAVVGKFIARQTVRRCLLANALRYTRVVRHRPEKATDIGFVFLFNFSTALIACFGIFPIRSDIIGTDGMHVVPINL